MSSLRIFAVILILSLAGCAPTKDSTDLADGAKGSDDKSSDPSAAQNDPAKAATERPKGPIPPPADVAAAPSDALSTESGMSYKVLKAGSGEERPVATSRVTVHYTGWTTDGKMFDSSLKRGKPAVFPLNRVIKGWTEGLQLMAVGEKTRFWIPGTLAYGDTPRRPGAPSGTLVFDIELLSFEAGPPSGKATHPRKTPAMSQLPAPADVAATPTDATSTASGLAYKVLTAGSGSERPNATSTVTVHYTGWTTDGKMFDSSVVRGDTISFPLNRVIKGWTEGLQLMVTGEKTRFWIPGNLAYGDTPQRPGAPSGTLVFDVELFSFE